MKTSQEWWNETKADLPKLNLWLQRQCFGEEHAYERIMILAEKFGNPVLHKIALDEFAHHHWIKRYLEEAGIPLLTEHKERYWNEINLKFENVTQVAAVGYHAEMMRLERIRIIANDETIPKLSDLFKRILIDEEYHAKAFKKLTTEEELEIAKIDHEQGMIELGLIA